MKILNAKVINDEKEKEKMFDKKYSVSEFIKIYDEAMAKSLENLKNNRKEAIRLSGQEDNYMLDMVDNMQNIMTMMELKKVILESLEKGEN